jgi:hypothetical protein
MVIVHPNDILGHGNLHYGITKLLVHLLVIDPVILIILDIGSKVVKKGPERFVRKTVIELVHAPLGKKNGVGMKIRLHLGFQ